MTDKVEKKQLILRKIVREINEHHAQFNEPIPKRLLSAKYSRSVNALNMGSFPEVMEELEMEGSIKRIRERSGKTTYLPTKALQELLEAGAL